MIEKEEESGGDQPVLDAIRGQTNIVPLTNNEEAIVGMGSETDRTGLTIPKAGELAYWNDSNMPRKRDRSGRAFLPNRSADVSRLLSGQSQRAVRACLDIASI